jgi:acetyl esterase/lipase
MRDVSWFADLMKAPNFDGLPKTVIYTAGCDPLRDEGEAYARRLVEGGCEVTVRRFLGVPHPFMHMDGGMLCSPLPRPFFFFFF